MWSRSNDWIFQDEILLSYAGGSSPNLADFTEMSYRSQKWHNAEAKVRFVQLNSLGLYILLISMFAALKQML